MSYGAHSMLPRQLQEIFAPMCRNPELLGEKCGEVKGQDSLLSHWLILHRNRESREANKY